MHILEDFIMEKIKNLFKNNYKRFINLCKGKKVIFSLVLTFLYMIFIGGITFNNYKSSFGYFLIMYRNN